MTQILLSFKSLSLIKSEKNPEFFRGHSWAMPCGLLICEKWLDDFIKWNLPYIGLRGGGLKWNLSGGVTPPKFNMEPENRLSKRKIIFQTPFLGFHVNFPGCSHIFPMKNSGAWKTNPPFLVSQIRPPCESYGTFVEHLRGEFLSQNLARNYIYKGFPKLLDGGRLVATQIFFLFTPKIGEDFQFDEHILSNGLVQPPK